MAKRRNFTKGGQEKVLRTDPKYSLRVGLAYSRVISFRKVASVTKRISYLLRTGHAYLRVMHADTAKAR